MSDWPLYAAGRAPETAGVNATFSEYLFATSGSTANTKGSYAQLIASTARAANGLLFIVKETSNHDCLVDIAVGAPGSEQIIIPDLILSPQTDMAVSYYFPIRVPASSRIAMRSQSTPGSAQVKGGAVLFCDAFLPSRVLGRVTSYGVDTTDSGGTQIDPGGVANTKGAYTQITASTTNPIRYLNMGFGKIGNTGELSSTWLIDIAVGAPGSEQIIIPDLMTTTGANMSISPPTIGIPITIPAASRIAVRAAYDGTDATARLFDIALYGVD